MAVRTARLAAGNAGASGAVKVIYVCPSGRTAIVKDIRLHNSTGGPIAAVLGLKSGAEFVPVLNTGSLDAGPRSFPDCWLALEPGDSIELVSGAAGGIQYWLSGTELEGVAP